MDNSSNMVSVSRESLEDMLICALRYCQGRQTYMPSVIIGIAINKLPILSDSALEVMLNDCKDQERYDLYGDPRIDKPQWLAFRQKLEEQINSRMVH